MTLSLFTAQAKVEIYKLYENIEKLLLLRFR